MAAMPAPTNKNCNISSNNATPPGIAPTTPFEADSTYDVMVRLTPSSNGPKVMAAQ